VFKLEERKLAHSAHRGECRVAQTVGIALAFRRKGDDAVLRWSL